MIVLQLGWRVGKAYDQSIHRALDDIHHD
jgi:hypothetical protein